MARNSRFRTTSGSSLNQKPFKKNTRKRTDAPGKREDSSKPGKEGNFSNRKSPVKPFAEKRKSFHKPRWRDEGNESSPPRSAGVENAKPFERKPKSFSKEGNPSAFKKSNTTSGKFHDHPDRRKSSSGRDRDFNKRYSDGDKTEKLKPQGKKSFVESRVEKSRKAETVSAESLEAKDGLVRLNKYISNSGVCSRREADDLIIAGLITVNGKSVTELGYKVKLADDVRYEGKRLKAEKPVYILLNKPKGFITTTDDPQERNTVMQLVSGACKERVYPVGRLDRNTSGLLLLTNDGDLTEKLSHPSHNVKKIYKAELDRPLTKNDFQKILDGVRLEEGKAVIDDLAIVSDDGKTVGLELHIGWNRIVRRIFESLGYEVVKLDRSVYATLDKKELPRGHWRFLRQDEVIRLKHFL